jgi:hypothetical protein
MSQNYVIPATYVLVTNSTGIPPVQFALGEQITSFINSSSSVSLSTNVVSNITSINLSPGIWNVSGMVVFKGAVGATKNQGSIVTTSATLGDSGNNLALTPTNPNAASDISLTIPPYRVNATSTMSVYLTAESTFSAGSISAYGSISATRVA